MIEPLEFIPRSKGLGLGAQREMDEKKKKRKPKPGETSESKVGLPTSLCAVQLMQLLLLHIALLNNNSLNIRTVKESILFENFWVMTRKARLVFNHLHSDTSSQRKLFSHAANRSLKECLRIHYPMPSAMGNNELNNDSK